MEIEVCYLGPMPKYAVHSGGVSFWRMESTTNIISNNKLTFSAHIQEKTVYRFVLEMDLMHLLDFNGMINN